MLPENVRDVQLRRNIQSVGSQKVWDKKDRYEFWGAIRS